MEKLKIRTFTDLKNQLYNIRYSIQRTSRAFSLVSKEALYRVSHLTCNNTYLSHMDRSIVAVIQSKSMKKPNQKYKIHLTMSNSWCTFYSHKSSIEYFIYRVFLLTKHWSACIWWSGPIEMGCHHGSHHSEASQSHPTLSVPVWSTPDDGMHAV